MHHLQQGSLPGLALVFFVVGTCSGATAADLYSTEVKLPDVVTNFSGHNISSPIAGDLCSDDVLSLLQTKSVIHHHAEINAREPLALAGRGKGPFSFDPEEVIHKSLAEVRQCLHKFLEQNGLLYYPIPFKQTLCKEGIMRCDTSILAQATDPIDAFINEKWKWFWFRTVPVVLAVLLVGCAGWFAHKSGTATRRTESWTGFRAFLATMIYLEHIGVHYLRGGSPFILLSGAVMALTTSNKRDVTSFWGYTNFVARRLVRIYPAYWLYLILSRDTMVSSSNPAELIQALIRAPQEDFETFLGYQSWGGVQRNHLWFVSTIIALYLMFPFINAGLLYLGTNKDTKRCALVACCCFFCDVVFLTHHFLTPKFVPEVPNTECNLYGLTELWVPNLYVPQGYMVHSIFGVDLDFYVHPFTRLPEFVMGITIAHMIQALSARTRPEQSGNDSPEWAGTQLAWATDAAAIAIVVLVVLCKRSDDENKYRVDSFGLGLVAPLFASFLFGLGFSTVPSYARKLLTLPFILELGKWSYGMYIWHPYVIMSFGCSFIYDNKVAQTCDADRLVLSYAWTVLAAFASFKFVEEPSCKLVTRLLQQSK